MIDRTTGSQPGKGPLRRGTKPKVPVQFCRRRHGRGPVEALRPDGAIGPDMNLADVTQHARADQGRRAAEIAGGGPLVAHLRGDLVVAGELGQHAGLVQRMRERLLHEAVFAVPHGHGGGQGVDVVRRAHRHGVDALVHLVQQLAEVRELPGLGKAISGRGQIIHINIANGHDVAQAAGVVGIGVALAFQPDAGEGDPLVGRFALGGGTIGDPIADPQGGGRLSELAAGDGAGHGGVPWEGGRGETKPKSRRLQNSSPRRRLQVIVMSPECRFGVWPYYHESTHGLASSGPRTSLQGLPSPG